jgi:uroporphyrinogen decarboxylase
VDRTRDSRFLKACRREPVDTTPVWFMRQAGRYMAEYRALRERHSLLDICRAPDLATEVTLQPVRRLDVDAAILFSDLLLPLEPMGLPFDFIKGEGPQLQRPIGDPHDIDRLKVFDPRHGLAHVLEAIGQIQAELAGRVPLIGFVGAPFTLASYAIEGGHSANFAKTKALMYGHPEAWHRLCEKLTAVAGDYVTAQIDAGVDAVQVFDSWVGTLNAADYREFALPHTRRIFAAAAGRVPTIHFGTGTSAILDQLRAAGGEVIGVDWRIPIDEAWEQIGFDRAVQGNLDPTVLLGPTTRMFQQTDDILERIGGRPGHIFNLGHGVLPSTPVEHVQMLAQYVHSTARRHR